MNKIDWPIMLSFIILNLIRQVYSFLGKNRSWERAVVDGSSRFL
jgi:hypothetical protein